RFDLLGEIAGQLERLSHAPAMMRHDSCRRIDRECEDFLRRLVRDFLNIHAAFCGDYKCDTRSLAIDQRRQVKFAIDRRPLFDIEPVDFLAMRAGLVRDQGRPENAPRFFFYVFFGLDALVAARLVSAPLPASPTARAGTPRGTGTPNSRKTALAWYSWMFMSLSGRQQRTDNSDSAIRYFGIRSSP